MVFLDRMGSECAHIYNIVTLLQGHNMVITSVGKNLQSNFHDEDFLFIYFFFGSLFLFKYFWHGRGVLPLMDLILIEDLMSIVLQELHNVLGVRFAEL